MLFGYYGYVVCHEIRYCYTARFAHFAQDCFGSWDSFGLSVKNAIDDFGGECMESVDCFG